MRIEQLLGAVVLVSSLVGCSGSESGSPTPPDAARAPNASAGPADPNPPATPPAGVSKKDAGWVHDKTGIALVWVPPGKFKMGDDTNEKARPAHEVTLTKGFFLGKTEVTLGQYRAYCKEAGVTPSDKANDLGDDHPAIFVSCGDASTFCKWAGLRLPTEAEWEWAARGSDGRVYPWGNEEPGTTRANFKGAEDGHEKTAPAGSFPAGASPVGALDMGGNVLEWVEDWFQDGYPEGPATDPTGPARAEYVVKSAAGVGGTLLRTFRGGCHTFPPERCKATDRGGLAPTRAVLYVGFRVALTP